MHCDSWTRLSSFSSRSYQSRSDVHRGGEYDAEEEQRPEFICPFCAETFDMVGLCCHVDEEHVIEAKNGVCPICAKRVGTNLVGHMTVQHGSLLRMQRRRRLRNGGCSSTLHISRKELKGGNLLSILKGSSSLVSASNTEPDSLLNSFIFSPPAVDSPASIQPNSSTKACSMEEHPTKNLTQRNVRETPLTDKDLEEKARQSEFVRGLVLSTFLDDDEY